MQPGWARSDSDQLAELEYAKPATITRKHYRLLLFVTLLNTILLISGFICAPFIQRTTGQFWQDFQRKREQANAQKLFLADYQKCLDYAPATTQPLYEEDPDRAAKLYAGGGYQNILDRNYSYVHARQWHVPVVTKPPMIGLLRSPTLNLSDIIFVHGRITPSGRQRLVCVAISAAQQMVRNVPRDPEGHPHHASVLNSRNLEIGVFRAGAGRLESLARNTKLQIYDRGEHPSEVEWTRDGSWDTAQVQFHLNGILRLLPVQLDSGDPTHFSIPYELDSVPGRIDAYLKNDDTVAIRPSVGRILDQDPSGARVVWDPYSREE